MGGLKLGIDFTGGSLLEIRASDARPDSSQIQKVLSEENLSSISIQPTQDNGLILRFKEVSEEEHQKILTRLKDNFEGLEENRFETIGPSIGKELKRKSIYAVITVILAIIAYIAYTFRKISFPVKSWKYGVSAVIALVHDITIVTGVFAFLGYFFNYEIDLLFITALLTILGYSINDTIVVFDRTRENLLKFSQENFENTVNKSVNETIARSINTALTTLLVLIALLIYGGSSIQNFVIALIAGVIFGTYSSIFIASPLLVVWNNLEKKN
jgi:preprotein translocase subunit SecF